MNLLFRKKGSAMQWTYITQTHTPASKDVADRELDILNQLGRQGWEQISVLLLPDGDFKYYFKRPIGMDTESNDN